jgi:mevalonate kinase
LSRTQPVASSAFAPGKVILLGEHAVVYGHPALAAPLTQGVRATATVSSRCHLVVPSALTPGKKKALAQAFERAAVLAGLPAVRITLESTLPVGVGLGSSAAVSVACARALLQASGDPARPKAVLAIAQDMERVFHGNPSGVDAACSALGQPLYFRKRSTGAPECRSLSGAKPLSLLVWIVGKRPPTKNTVEGLRARVAAWPSRYGRILGEIGTLVREGAACVEAGDLEGLGDAMNVNHGLLAALGLSAPDLDEAVFRLRAWGALGAKLTGAGGKGGAVIGLFENPSRALGRLRRAREVCFTSRIVTLPRKPL